MSVLLDGVPPLEEAMPPPEEEPEPVLENPEPAFVAPVVFPHAPYEAGDCASCHDVDLGNQSDNSSALCYSCHDEMVLPEFVHTPVAEGDCRVCHDPHQSGYRFQLVTSPRQLCLECHDLPDQGAAAVSHASPEDELCTDCHDPHGSSYTFSLEEPVVTVCWRCHDEELLIDDDHAASGQKGCPDCHSYHGTERDTLIADLIAGLRAESP
jgi:predicted CXXCH cytochrome family protein